MYQIMKRIVLLALLAWLMMAKALANCAFLSFLFICKFIADLFQLQATEEKSVSTVNNCTQTTNDGIQANIFTQTDTEIKEPEKVSNSGTKVIIYNLNSAQKLVISPEGNDREITSITSQIVKDVTTQTVDLDFSSTSCMSLENDVIDSKIESGHRSASESSNSEIYYKLEDILNLDNEILNTNASKSISEASDKNNKNSSSNYSNATYNLDVNHEDFRNSKIKTIMQRLSYPFMKCDDAALNSQKTSSPIKAQAQSPQPSCTNLSTTSKESQAAIFRDARISPDSEDRENESWNKDTKRRLSLPVKLNSSIKLTNFRQQKQKLIEEALKHTSRHETSFKEIKYPFSSEISKDGKDNDGKEDKEVMSASSYESLPVADHVQNSLENSMLLHLYGEILCNEEKLDTFVQVDNLVKSFKSIKKTLPEENSIQSKISPTQSKISFFTEQRTEITDKNNLESFDPDEYIQQVCDEYHKYVSDGMENLSEVFSKIVETRGCEEKTAQELLKYSNSGDKENSEVGEGEYHSSIKKLINLESENCPNKIEMKLVSSKSPLKRIPKEKSNIYSDRIGDLDKSGSHLEGNDYAPHFSQQMLINIIFEEIPTTFKSCMNQITYEENDKDHLSSDVPTLSTKNDSRESETREAKKPIKEYDFSSYHLPSQLLNESDKNEGKINKMGCMSSVSSDKFTLADYLQCSDTENPVLCVKNKLEAMDSYSLTQYTKNLQQAFYKETLPELFWPDSFYPIWKPNESPNSKHPVSHQLSGEGPNINRHCPIDKNEALHNIKKNTEANGVTKNEDEKSVLSINDDEECKLLEENPSLGDSDKSTLHDEENKLLEENSSGGSGSDNSTLCDNEKCTLFEENSSLGDSDKLTLHDDEKNKLLEENSSGGSGSDNSTLHDVDKYKLLKKNLSKDPSSDKSTLHDYEKCMVFEESLSSGYSSFENSTETLKKCRGKLID